MNKYVLIAGIIAIAGIGWYVWSPGTSTQAPVNIEVQEEPTEVSEIEVNLQEQNESGESGTAVITEVEGKVRVVLNLTGEPEDGVQPAHIHTNSCADLGGVQYPLESLTNGSSETILEVSMAELQTGLPLSINVHKSPEEAGVYVACGNIVL